MSEAVVFHLTPHAEDVALVRELLAKNGLYPELIHVASRSDYTTALGHENVALILCREQTDGLGALDALQLARAKRPEVPFICISDATANFDGAALAAAGVDDCVSLAGTWQLLAALRRGLKAAAMLQEQRRCKRRDRAMGHLLAAVQELSLARDVQTVQTIVRRAARALTGAHGATFVLREGDKCYYADEDAIGPLWKGQRFPMSVCISGWVMTHRKPVVIEDIYADSRIPWEAYRPTFVKSLLMVPIRTESPIGAIGNYWADSRRAHPEDIELLQALANTTAVAMENVRVYAELEQRVKDRTRLLEETNRELEAFSYSVSHDLRSPLSAVMAYSDLLKEVLSDSITPEVKDCCNRIVLQSQRMSGLIRDLLRLAQMSRAELKLEAVDLTKLAREKLKQFAETEPSRQVETIVAEETSAEAADPTLMNVVLENLLSNAWKYTGKVPHARIEFGSQIDEEGREVYFVRDNGAGFNPKQADRLFAPFQRLHRQDEYPGVGVGLATVQRILHKHGGRVWAEGAPGKGATFYFTLPKANASVVHEALQTA